MPLILNQSMTYERLLCPSSNHTVICQETYLPRKQGFASIAHRPRDVQVPPISF